MNISQNADTVVFCGTFTAGGLQAVPADGLLQIEAEGRHRKFVDAVDQVTFSAAEARRRGQRILYVTERAVFELGADGLVLIEVAPGVDLQRDVLDLLDFPVTVADDLQLMDRRIFTDEPLGARWRLTPTVTAGPDTAEPAPISDDLAPTR